MALVVVTTSWRLDATLPGAAALTETLEVLAEPDEICLIGPHRLAGLQPREPDLPRRVADLSDRMVHRVAAAAGATGRCSAGASIEALPSTSEDGRFLLHLLAHDGLPSFEGPGDQRG